MDVLRVSGAGGLRRCYRNGRGTRLGGAHPLSLGAPKRWGGHLAGRHAVSTASVVQGIAKLPWLTVSTFRQGAPSHLRCVHGSA